MLIVRYSQKIRLKLKGFTKYIHQFATTITLSQHYWTTLLLYGVQNNFYSYQLEFFSHIITQCNHLYRLLITKCLKIQFKTGSSVMRRTGSSLELGAFFFYT